MRYLFSQMIVLTKALFLSSSLSVVSKLITGRRRLRDNTDYKPTETES